MKDYPANAVVRLTWNTNAADGSSITRATDGTLKIYKNDSVTERSSLAGVTQTENFAGNAGVHRVVIDLSDDTDAGFYAAGSHYAVVMTGMVIDGKTVNAVIGEFSIELAGGALALAKAVKAKTDNLPNDPASNAQVNTRLATSGYTAPDNAGIAALQGALAALAGIFPVDPASQATVLAAIAALQVVLVGMQARVLAQHQPYPVTLDGGTGTKVVYKYGEARPLTLAVKDALGNAVDLSGAALLLGVKKDKGDAAYTFSKLDAVFNKAQAALGIVSVYIAAADTSQPAATYVGELKCTWAGAEEIIEKTGDLSIEIKKAVT